MKKYGVVFFKNSQNIGDDIQTYAASKLLPKVDYYIERESLNEFVSDDGEIVNTILSGWFLHDVYSFPPSKFINPLCISMHLTDHLLNDCPDYMCDLFIDYLKRFEPIGCRDSLVKKYLDDYKIKNYFSGCLTLTLKPFKGIKKSKYVCLVDVPDNVINHINKLNDGKVKIFSHLIDSDDIKNLTCDERMKRVESLLKNYQGAKYVVTTRLHCALPCLALGVPVLLITNNSLDFNNRIGEYYNFLNISSGSEILEGKMDALLLNGFNNKPDYLSLTKKLCDRVEEFVNKKSVEYSKNIEYKNMYINDTVKLKKYFVQVSMRTPLNKIDSLEKRICELENEYKSLEKTKNDEIWKLNNHLNLVEHELKKELEISLDNYSTKMIALQNEKQAIINSRSYKIARKISGLLRKIKGSGK